MQLNVIYRKYQTRGILEIENLSTESVEILRIDMFDRLGNQYSDEAVLEELNGASFPFVLKNREEVTMHHLLYFDFYAVKAEIHFKVGNNEPDFIRVKAY